jgi:catechol 2,3-dioxygenase-like lactoylglutathione lyase family enzyme
MANETIRGIDHVGIYVPDIDAATKFLQEAFGARVIYESLAKTDPEMDLEKDGLIQKLAIAPGTVMRSQRFLTFGRGPDLELFEMHAPGQTSTTGKSDFGINHFAVYADDIDAAVERFERAGGKMNFRPTPIPFETETGDGVKFCYGTTPWGMNVEFITYPGEMGYEKTTALRRWHRGS